MTTITEHNGGAADTIAQLMTVPDEKRDVEWLKNALQNALILELATIPAYCCGLWSIVKSDVEQPIEPPPPEAVVSSMIFQIIIDEMSHMGLVGNMLSAIGGAPKLCDEQGRERVPKYPCKLPGNVRPGLVVRLTGLTRGSLDMYSQIEMPDKPLAVLYTADTAETYTSIGAFYQAIESAFRHNKPKLKFSEDKQIFKNISQYGKGNDIVRMTKVDDVVRYISIIKEQGEGTTSSPLNPYPLEKGELSHYYAFREHYHSRKLQKVASENKWEFNGENLRMPETYAVAEVPAGGWPRNNYTANVIEKLNSFNKQYSQMLRHLEKAWATSKNETNILKKQGTLVNSAISNMKQMGILGREIMKTPLPHIPNVSSVNSGWHYCPEFLFDKSAGI
jgi:hypothetical protein